MDRKSRIAACLVVGVSSIVGIAPPQARTRSYGDDALPSAEVTAFQRIDARLRYRGARIERNSMGCAVYEGRRRDGQVARRLLRDARGNPICANGR